MPPPQISAQYNPFPMDFDLDLYTGFWKETKYMSSSTEPPPWMRWCEIKIVLHLGNFIFLWSIPQAEVTKKS